jgi:hypothetical protein
MKVMLTYFHELVSPHSVSFVVYLSFCLYSRRNIAPDYYERCTTQYSMLRRTVHFYYGIVSSI